MEGLFQSLFTTRWGTGVVLATHMGICQVELPDMTLTSAVMHKIESGRPASMLTESAAVALHRYYAGENVPFMDLPVDLGAMTPFRVSILTAIRQIRYGEVWSYARVAVACGSPQAARAVGGALAANPVPVIVPCHRIVGADGSLTGFSAAGGTATKKFLLEMEGVEFTGMKVPCIRGVMNR
ncbi:MAG TPA: methylated-DNA--[protein]-cysteine S-methyltransferase [Desulfuromonadales bacterium]|nr:methylated-DNA--[protein]-cysteine S-methyltransferase [Desulfuromonadales bacterium]